MVTFTFRAVTEDAPLSPQGVAARSWYDGPHGPVFVASSDGDQVTRAWGPDVPDARLEFGPAGRFDGKRHTSFADPVALSVGTFSGEVAQPGWALLNRRKRGMVISLGPRSYLYRVTGMSSPLLERADRSPVARLGGAFGAHQVDERADAVDVALALVMFAGVGVGVVKAQS